MKKVLLVVIDALATRAVEAAFSEGRLPNFRRLVDAGWMKGNCVPIFPSITPAATAGIVTGCYPRETRIAGAYFYDAKQDRVHYYGDDFWVILQEGLGRFFNDFLKELNFQLLQCDTLFERVERSGLRSACINYIWFRGDVEHEVNVPWLLRLVPGVPSGEKVKGPQVLCLGDFVTSSPRPPSDDLSAEGGMFHRFGFDDHTTAQYLLDLVRKGDLPEFTLAYFPDNDFRSHEVGPYRAIDALEKIDDALGRVIDCWPSLEAMLDDVAVVITGDHSQTDMRSSEARSINLDETLHGYELVEAGAPWQSDEQLMVCPNMRAAQIYLRRGYWDSLEEMCRRLLAEERIDQVIWRRNEGANRTTFHIATRDRGRLKFWLVSRHEPGNQDVYGCRWRWEGDLATVDAKVADDGGLRFGEYPNAFERIAMAFHDSVSGDMWATARLGHAFYTPRISVHTGGSHGALHRIDSEVPLIVSGAPSDIAPPQWPRTVDVAPLCLSILGIKSPRQVGASHLQVDCSAVR